MCGGSYVGPVPEACNDGADGNCNGVVDEGCACSPVAMNAGNSIAMTGTITKMISDPQSCFIYALNTGSPSQVVVIDTSNKSELTRINLPFTATDIDISANGSVLAVAHGTTNKISIIDKGLWTVGQTISTLSDVHRLEVTNSGMAYYVEYDQWVDIRRINLQIGSSSDVILGSWALYAGDLEMSANETFLFAGESGISGGDLNKYNITGPMLSLADQSAWNGGYGFSYPARHVYLSPSSAHIYYAGYQLDGTNLKSVRGSVGQRVFVEDAAATFAVGETKVLDASLVKTIATLPQTASAAALTAADRELWYYNAQSARAYYRAIDDFTFGVPLGVRERQPLPLSSYSFSRLVHDPVAPRLYGLDAARESVVFIDASTLLPTLEILLGAQPTDLAVDSTGSFLYAGHFNTMAIAKINLANQTFAGFIPTPRIPYEIEALSGGRLAMIDEDQWTTVTLINATTGMVLDSKTSIYEGALTSTADGNTLFVGESSISGGDIRRYNVSGGLLTLVDISDYDNGYGFPYPARRARAIPDGSGVFYAGYLLDGADLSILKYPMTTPIYTVTPNSLRAISQSTVYNVTTGMSVGALPVQGTVQAVSPDGMRLYVWTGSSLATVNLSMY